MDTNKQAAETTAKALLTAKAFLVRPKQPFRLTSGLLAPFYINCRQLLSHAHARTEVAEALAARIDRDAIDIVAGGVTAGVPFATLVADRLSLPLVYIRPEPKGHGTGSQIEGGNVAGKRVLLVEDLITTATSIQKFVTALREADAHIERVSVVFSRMTADAETALRDMGVAVDALCALDDLLDMAVQYGITSGEDMKEVRAFLADPNAWSAAHGGGETST